MNRLFSKRMEEHVRFLRDKDEGSGCDPTPHPAHAAPVHLDPGGPGGQDGRYQDHQRQRRHACTEDHKCQLHWLYPEHV